MSAAVIGVDLGGTQLRAGLVVGERLLRLERRQVPRQGVLEAITELVDSLVAAGGSAIGVGVPSLVDRDTGLVRDVPNIPSWRDVPLGDVLRARYRLQVRIANDASCFTVAEHRFGAARGKRDVVGLVLGTGAGGGLIIDGRLYEGQSGGAGELGMLPYRDRTFEYYCSGQLFVHEHQTSGETAYAAALRGDVAARALFATLGDHLGRFVQAVMCAVDPEMIVLGGSVSRAFHLFEPALRASLATFPYPSSVARLALVRAALDEPGVIGAAALVGEGAA